MNLSVWFHDQLQAGGDGFVWSVQQVPDERRLIQPPEGLSKWSVAHHVFHMLFYEKKFALPGMRQWLSEPRPFMQELDESAAWNENRQDTDTMLGEFRQVRAQQVALLAQFSDADWNMTRETVWGPVALTWVVSKTYQHTAEHIHDVMEIALFWDRHVEQHKERANPRTNRP